MEKVDLRKREHELYSAPSDHAVVVDVPDGSYVMLDGVGGPTEGGAFQEAIGTLYTVAYSIKLSAKAADRARDFVVMPLEALWWWDGSATFHAAPEHTWHWTLMIRLPEFVTPHDVERAIANAKQAHPLAVRVRFGRLHEGRAMQILHVGPYKNEWPTLEKLHSDMRRAGYAYNGKHHEIYLGDPRRAKPEKLKTILRQPVRWTDEAEA